MLESPLQVAVIGPASTREEAGKIVQAAVARWLTVKDRRKLARKLKEETRTQPALVTTEARCQTETIIIADQLENKRRNSSYCELTCSGRDQRGELMMTYQTPTPSCSLPTK